MSEDLDFKNIRQSKGLTLDDIVRRTRIRKGFLEAIEEGNYHLLPEKYYAETFIKVYADTLGIDSDPFLARYRQFLEKTGATTQKEPQHEIKGEPGKHFTRPSLTKGHYRLFGWAILLAVVMAIIFFILYPREMVVEVPAPPLSAVKPPDVSEHEKPATEVPSKSEAVEKPRASQEKTEVKEQVESKKETTPTGIGEESKKKYTLRIEALELTWLRIKEDKQAPRQYLLQPGEKLSRQAVDRFEVDIGNAGGVQLNFQGKSLGTPGKSGEVVHLVLPGERTF
jgi:cytoskeleton protein RodZ